jgi:hypothetical protein
MWDVGFGTGHRAWGIGEGVRSQNPEFRFQLLCFSSLKPETLRFGTWDVRCGMMDAGYWILDAGCSSGGMSDYLT